MTDTDILNQLNALGDHVEFLNFRGEVRSPVPAMEKLRIWKEHFGEVMPDVFFRHMAKNMDKLTIQLLPKEGYSNSWADFTFQDGGNTAVIETCWQRSRPLSAVAAWTMKGMNVVPQTGAGTAKKVLQNMSDLCNEVYPRMKQLSLAAAFIGSYAWARFGFRPEGRSWREEVQPELIRRKALIADQLTAEEHKALDKLIGASSSKAIWAIADLAKPVKVPQFLIEKVEKDQYLRLDPELLLGKYLLLGNEWSGSLNLRDTKAMYRFKGYLATIGISRDISPSANAKGIS